MSDDEDARESTAIEVTFVADDGTVEIPHPAWRLFVFPTLPVTDEEFETLTRQFTRFFTLPHPRTGNDVLMCVCPTSGNDAASIKTSPCIVQPHRPTDYSAWLIDDRVESDGNLYLVHPFDMSYLAIWVLLRQASKPIDSAAVLRWASDPEARPALAYKDVVTLLAVDDRLDAVSRLGLTQKLEDAMAAVADVQTVGDDRYYRLSLTKTCDLIRGRFEKLVSLRATKRIVYPTHRAEPKSNAPLVETKKRAGTRSKTERDNDASAAELAQPSRNQPSADVAGTPARSTVATDVPTELAGATDLRLPDAGEGGDAGGSASPTLPQPAAAAEDTYLPLRALHLLLDFVPKPMHGAIGRACGVPIEDAADRASKAKAAASSSWAEAHMDAVLGGPGAAATPSAGPKRSTSALGSAAKSQSVKRLEKKGAPKGTPSLTSMFAKASKK